MSHPTAVHLLRHLSETPGPLSEVEAVLAASLMHGNALELGERQAGEETQSAMIFAHPSCCYDCSETQLARRLICQCMPRAARTAVTKAGRIFQ